MRLFVTNSSRKFLSCRGKIRTFPAPHGERPLVVPKLPRAPPTDHTRPLEASRTRLRAGRQAGDHRHTEQARGPGINSSALLRGMEAAQPASSHTDSDNRAVTLTRCGSAGADPDPEQLRRYSGNIFRESMPHLTFYQWSRHELPEAPAAGAAPGSWGTGCR